MAMVALAFLLAECGADQRVPDDPPASVVLRWDSAAPDPLAPRNDPPDAILIRWTAASASDIDASELAERHCLAWDRRAEQVREQVSGDTWLAEFVCRPLLGR